MTPTKLSQIHHRYLVPPLFIFWARSVLAIKFEKKGMGHLTLTGSPFEQWFPSLNQSRSLIEPKYPPDTLCHVGQILVATCLSHSYATIAFL